MEVNKFTWVGPDVRKTQSGEFSYGFLPGNMTKDIVARIRERARNRELDVIGRDDENLKQRLAQMSKAIKARTGKKGRERER